MACVTRYNNSNNNTYDDIYGAVIMAHSHCKSLPGSLDEIRRVPTLRPSQTTWAVSPTVPATIHIHHRHFIITQLES